MTFAEMYAELDKNPALVFTARAGLPPMHKITMDSEKQLSLGVFGQPPLMVTPRTLLFLQTLDFARADSTVDEQKVRDNASAWIANNITTQPAARPNTSSWLGSILGDNAAQRPHNG